MLLAVSACGHVVSQISGEWKGGDPWEIEVLFDAGYAMPEMRGDRDAPAPQREWLVSLGEAGWAPLRKEAERYLRECLQVKSTGRDVVWRVEFIDFEKSPPDFPELLNDGAYFRMKLTGETPLESGAQIAWQTGERPAFVLKLPAAGYLTLAPGQSALLPVRETVIAGHASWIEAFRQGFLHVLPLGLDHVLFVMGLFFYHRAWRPLLSQSLAFTLAHTITLGLAAVGWVRVPGGWVEPMIALSLVVIALENLRSSRNDVGPARLGIVFGFGLVHGLGFAGALSVWLKPGDGFLASLMCANLGVEAAQATLLAAAWCLTIRWHVTPHYRRARWAGCIAIAGIGAFWCLQRLG
jgi:hypothetical protein